MSTVSHWAAGSLLTNAQGRVTLTFPATLNADPIFASATIQNTPAGVLFAVAIVTAVTPTSVTVQCYEFSSPIVLLGIAVLPSPQPSPAGRQVNVLVHRSEV